MLDVVDEGDRIAHLIAASVAGESVRCEIDWPQRYDHMQQHTGQHVLSAVWVELFDVPTLSFHMGADVSTIELGTKELNRSQIETAELRANEIVREARPVTIAFEDAASAEGLRKASARSGTLRIIEIDRLDRSACGGTHVRSTAELGPILIRKAEKLRGNTRIEFVCGERAVRRARKDYEILSDLSKTVSAAPDELPQQLTNLKLRLGESEKARQRLSGELARFEGSALHSQTVPDPDGIRRVFQTVPSIDDSTRLRMQALTAEGKAVALVIAEEPPGILIACSPDAGFHAGPILKAALSAAGTRGGGSAVLAQGSLPEADVIPSIKDALGFAP